MTMRVELSLLLSIALLLAGCDSSDSGSSPETADTFIPIAEGHSWTFTSSINRIDGATLRIDGTRAVNGTDYKRIDISVRPDSRNLDTREYVIRNRSEDELYIARVDSSGETDQLFGFVLRTGASDGDSYIHTDERGKAYTVDVRDRSVNVPAGSFDGLEFRVSPGGGGIGPEAITFAPDIGPVFLDYGQAGTLQLFSTNADQ
jgi:hypothetical protein